MGVRKNSTATAEIHYLFASGSLAPLDGAVEQRKTPRRRVLKAAVAAYADRYCVVPCVLRDISAKGARLRSQSTLNIPDTFDLIVDLDGIEVSCEVVWRIGEDIGVRFVGAPRKVAPRRSQVVNSLRPDRTCVKRRRILETPK